MFFSFVNTAFFMLYDRVQKDPGIIVGPISKVLGYILNFIFTGVNFIFERHSLGLSIIIFTMVVRALMVPLAVKQQKSMAKMQGLQPEIEKIKKKYGDTKDPELTKKMNAEIQTMYSKSGVNPLAGCLPLFIQFPIFIALNYVMQQSFRFIDKLGIIYQNMENTIYQIPNYADTIKEYAALHVPLKQNFSLGLEFPGNLQKVLAKFKDADWNGYLNAIKDLPQYLQIHDLYLQKNNIEYFLGIALLEVPGYLFPGIMIPIFAALTTFLSSWFMNKMTKSTDNNVKMQQRIMLIVMPIMMGYFTLTMPAGVGLYWVSSSVFQIFQQIILNKRFAPKAPVVPAITTKK